MATGVDGVIHDAVGRQVHLVSVGVEQEPFWPLLFRDKGQGDTVVILLVCAPSGL